MDSFIKTPLVLIAVTLSAGCNPPANTANKSSLDDTSLTYGAVQLKLRKGVTTQSEVLETFGSPNITALDGDGREMWTYRRHATVTNESKEGGYFNVLVFGTTSGSRSESVSTNSMTLIIKFDASKVVSDFRSMSSNF